MNIIFWGGLLRLGEAALAGAPTLLVGLVVAGVFRRLIGPETTLRLFGGTGWRSLPQAWLWGMLLPVCSIGMIPVAIELRRAGLKGGTILAFALTAPLFNPLSLLYGLTLSTPFVILVFAFGSLIVVTIVGSLWDVLFPGSRIDPGEPTPIPPGLARMAAVALVAARHMAGPTAIYAAIGLAGSIVLSAIYPFGSLTDTMSHADKWAPAEMLVVALPAYATPLNVMMQVGGMFVHGNSPGAAFVLLSLGTGANLGLLVWAWRTWGLGRSLVFLVAFVSVVMMIAYAVNDRLNTAGNVEHAHTHAFDVYACPFPASTDDLPTKVWSGLQQEAQLYQFASLAIIGCLFVVGMGLLTWDPQQELEQSLEQSEVGSVGESSLLNATIPAPALGVIAALGLVVLSVVGCFVYYPAPDQTLEDMRIVKADALTYATSEDVEQAVRSIERYDDLTRRLEVGYFLRNWQLSEHQRARARVLRGRLERLKDMLEAGEFDRARKSTLNIFEAHRRVAESFQR